MSKNPLKHMTRTCSEPFLILSSPNVLPVTAPLMPGSHSVPRLDPKVTCTFSLSGMSLPHAQANRRQALGDWWFSQPRNEPIWSVPTACPVGIQS